MESGLLFSFSKTNWQAKVPLDPGTGCHWWWWGAFDDRRGRKKEVKLLQAEQSLTLAFSQGGLTFLGLSVTCICWLWSKVFPQWNSLISKTIHKYTTYMVAHKTRSSRCSFRLTPDHPILAPGSWWANPKEWKKFESHIFDGSKLN